MCRTSIKPIILNLINKIVRYRNFSAKFGIEELIKFIVKWKKNKSFKILNIFINLSSLIKLMFRNICSFYFVKLINFFLI